MGPITETNANADSECVACGVVAAAPVHTVAETMYGTGEQFDYHQCPACGSLQIAVSPADLSAYYPDTYYSFEPSPRQMIKDRLSVGLQQLVRRLPAPGDGGTDLAWMEFAGVDRLSRIVDVGCGSGRMLRRLEALGFSNLQGADPFLTNDLVLPRGTPIVRTGVDGLSGEFDLLMFNHSFEHTLDPLATLKEARQRLKADGRLLVRVPVVAQAFADFGVHWAQLDAPRHLHLQTVEGMHQLARRAGLQVTRARFDSGSFQFWASEQNRTGIPLASAQSYATTRFSFRPSVRRTQILRYALEARRRNRWSTGDQAGFLLELDQ